VPSNFRFAGMLWDPESNLNHTWFRQYDSAQGRWMGADPIEGSSESPRTMNRYVYVLNDPVNLVDPLGLYIVCFETDNEYVCIEFIGAGGGDLFALDHDHSGGGGDGGGGGDSDSKPCSAELKYRGIDSKDLPWWKKIVIRLRGATHAFWQVQDRTGQQTIITAFPEIVVGGPPQGYLNVAPEQVPQGGAGTAAPSSGLTAASVGVSNAAAKTRFSTGLSPENCDEVDKLLAAARSFPNNTIPYDHNGPNSNSAARWLGGAAGLNPRGPRGAVGWGTVLSVPLPSGL